MKTRLKSLAAFFFPLLMFAVVIGCYGLFELGRHYERHQLPTRTITRTPHDECMGGAPVTPLRPQ